jgi:hypothetical protein
MQDVVSHRHMGTSAHSSLEHLSMCAPGHALNEEYWTHVEFFPELNSNIEGAVQQLESALGYGLADHLTSDNSTFPYDDTQCRKLMKILRTPGLDDVHRTWVVGKPRLRLEMR